MTTRRSRDVSSAAITSYVGVGGAVAPKALCCGISLPILSRQPSMRVKIRKMQLISLRRVPSCGYPTYREARGKVGVIGTIRWRYLRGDTFFEGWPKNARKNT